MKLSNIQSGTPFSIGNIGLVTVQRERGYKMDFSEGRKQHSFIYTVRGSICYSFFKSEVDHIVSQAGELVFIPAGTQHSSTYIQEENQVQIVQFDLLEGELPDYLNSPSTIKIDNVAELFSSFYVNDTDNSIYFLYKTYELLWRASIQAETIPFKFKKLKFALSELTFHHADNRKISDYAQMCGMSEPGFRRLFVEYTGVSPIEYRNRIRLKEARKMLRSGEYRVDEIAFLVGFSNISFFCRSYKKLFGYSPKRER